MTPHSNHKFYTASGLTARSLLALVKVIPPPTDVVVAAAFGIVEVLGARRFYSILYKAVRQQIRSAVRANINSKRRAPVAQKPRAEVKSA